MCNSNKGTGGMESSVALFKPRIHLFACTHPSVSISLVCNDWLAYTHQSTALYQTRLDYVMVQCGRPSRSSSKESVRSSFGRTVMGKAKFERILLQHGWEKVSNWECLVVHRQKGLFLPVFVVT